MSVQRNASSAFNERPQTAIPNRPFPLKRVVGALLAVALSFAAAALLLPKSAEAKDVIGLNDAQMKKVGAIEDYLNAITTMQTRFMQVTTQGQFAQGHMWMERPGRMRIDYDEPVPLLIVSDGTIVMYKDEELDQLSYVPLNTIPASIFINEDIDFSGEDLLITDFEDEAGALRLTVQRSADPLEGSLTLVFEAKPLQLKKWAVVDAQGITTTVSLLGTRFGDPLKDDLFKVENRVMGDGAN